jgi:hypothetical protein
LNFSFKITKKRLSKFGDYRFHRQDGSHTITINHDLNPHAFLTTYIHEVAHLITFEKHQRAVLPHGKEWKRNFQKLMLPLLREDIYPMTILSPLALHMKNPKASSASDSRLYKVLHNDHQNHTKSVLLEGISIGTKFLFNKKVYRKVEKKRTRSVCELVNSGKRYLISDSAPVQPFKN